MAKPKSEWCVGLLLGTHVYQVVSVMQLVCLVLKMYPVYII